ncbi:6,7-dimethyl-8-ribityllumazine synthase [Sodalis-like secondary symbiont of Drepanosiphum platanoidis]|uniref:6,7-dimethyl-8-ribityllumazine synthase n=1 Tax=Sodalis-like secondary symbiont of Drepanosiphum platanoidis TaxID=2994493 RepID=UPI0034639754
MKIIEGKILSPKSKIAIVVSRFNKSINNNLLDGALNTLKRVGQVKDDNITIVWVPGAYEIPLIVNILSLKKFDAIIALATIIKGNTSHFEFISSSCSSEISSISIKNSLPIIFGILTTNNIEQAIERSGTKLGNKGIDAALSALESINIIKYIKNI